MKLVFQALVAVLSLAGVRAGHSSLRYNTIDRQALRSNVARRAPSVESALSDVVQKVRALQDTQRALSSWAPRNDGTLRQKMQRTVELVDIEAREVKAHQKQIEALETYQVNLLAQQQGMESQQRLMNHELLGSDTAADLPEWIKQFRLHEMSAEWWMLVTSFFVIIALGFLAHQQPKFVDRLNKDMRNTVFHAPTICNTKKNFDDTTSPEFDINLNFKNTQKDIGLDVEFALQEGHWQVRGVRNGSLVNDWNANEKHAVIQGQIVTAVNGKRDHPEQFKDKWEQLYRKKKQCTITFRREGFACNQAYDPFCVRVLSALGETERWNGKWNIDDPKKMELFAQIDKFNESTDQLLQKAELKKFMEDGENNELVKAMPTSLHGLLVDTTREKGFQEIDKNGNGFDRNEWLHFLAFLEFAHTEFLLRKSFLSFRAFYGRNQVFETWSRRCQTGKVPMALEKRGYPKMCTQVIQFGRDPDIEEVGNLVPDGWWADLVYYYANNHAFIAIFSADTENPLSRGERIVIELTGFAFSFASKNLNKQVMSGNPPFGWRFLEIPIVFDIFCVSLPGIILWYFLFFLYTTPGIGHVDEATSTPEDISRAERIRQIGEMLGHVTAIASFVFICQTADLFYVPTILRGRCLGYLLTLVTPLCLSFSPFFVFGQEDLSLLWSAKEEGFSRGFWGWLGNLVGIGQWRVEKQFYQALCVDRMTDQNNKEMQSKVESAPVVRTVDYRKRLQVATCC